MKVFVTLLLTICFNLVLFAKVSLPFVFSDHMVLQREIDIPVWGTADPGIIIKVVLADKKVEANADNKGNWIVRIPQFEADGPYTLEVFEDDNKEPSIVFSDVLIGDVWFASGQSNMEWQVQQSEGANEEIPKADNKNIRFFNVPHNKSINPLKNVLKGEWLVCDSNTVKTTSAIAYYFAKRIEADSDVPVGILQSTWGGTTVEAWTSRDMLISQSILKERMLKNDTVTNEHFIKDSVDLLWFWDIVYNPINGMDTIIPAPGYNDENWREVAVPGAIWDWEPEFYEGMIWLRKIVILEDDFFDIDLTVNLGYPEMNYSLYFNGNEICKNIWNVNLTHTYSIPASIIKKGENTICLRMAALWGGGGLNPPAKNIYLTNGKQKIELTGKWKYKKDIEPAIPKIFNYHQYPTFLFNAMINPVIPYGLKGFLWYQGENNENNSYDYRMLFPLLINDWRNRWLQGDLPFLYVQLPNYLKPDSVPSDSKWAVLRESQSQALQLPNTGMACIIDLGEAGNIHPKNKTDVSNRLAAIAEKIVYKKNMVASGPVFESYIIEENKIRIKFSETVNGLKTSNDKPVEGFAIAGSDQKFFWAKASIQDNEVIVSSDQVKHPVAVRYAWANNPICNLINSEGLPAVPFRTDKWKVITE